MCCNIARLIVARKLQQVLRLPCDVQNDYGLSGAIDMRSPQGSDPPSFYLATRLELSAKV
ncbi:hypothetical protein RSAG8_09491, partial [Rhizoctonia solani AG-8 WAC10335]